MISYSSIMVIYCLICAVCAWFYQDLVLFEINHDAYMAFFPSYFISLIQTLFLFC